MFTTINISVEFARIIKTFLLVLTIFGAMPIYSQSIKQGDNIQEEFKKIDNLYFFETPSFTDWIEGSKMLFIGSKPNPITCDFLFIALQDTTLIGIYKVQEPSSFVFDTEGNSILSETSEFFVLPLWTVKNKARITSSDSTVLKLLDDLYEQTLQANDEQPDEKTINQFFQYRTDTTLANRHIVYLFDTYQNLITETASKGEAAPAYLCIPLIQTLASECVSLYNFIPVIVCVFMGEALISADLLDDARKHFELCLQFYPESIPLLVYNYRLELNSSKKEKMLENLKKNYSKHWMVRDL